MNLKKDMIVYARNEILSHEPVRIPMVFAPLHNELHKISYVIAVISWCRPSNIRPEI